MEMDDKANDNQVGKGHASRAEDLIWIAVSTVTIGKSQGRVEQA